jgi:hypothetical protein
VVVAYHSIQAGEEITVRYRLPEVLRLPGAQRRKQLLDHALFACGCATCSQTGEARRQSDANRRRLGAIVASWEKQGLDRAIGPARAQTLDDVDEAVALCRAEGLVGDLSAIWLQKFYVHAAHAEFDEAKAAARKALASFARVRGRHAVEQHWMAMYARDPMTWESYGICRATQAG